MGIREDIALYDSKIDKTYWTEQNVNSRSLVVLPVENYYKILQKSFSKIGDNSGTCARFNTNNFAEYYANANDETIAVVNSVKTVNSTPVNVAIATYHAYNGKIAILNRFDQSGRRHDNYLNVYGQNLTTDETDFYKKYLADFEFTDHSGVHHLQAKVPHIHFNTKSQTLAFNHHDKANAISIEKLIEYVNDLMTDLDPTSLINNIDMGMPFLDLKNAKLTYTSTMLSALQNIINFFNANRQIAPEKFSDYEKETLDLMKSLINIDPGSNGKNASPTPTPNLGNTPQGSPENGDNSPAGTPENTDNGDSSSVSASVLTETDLNFFISNMPPLDQFDIMQLNQIKSYVSKYINHLGRYEKDYLNNDFNRRYPEDRFFESRQHRADLRIYLKYIKGLINLKQISADLNKYLKIYKVLDERDPLLLSFVSKELLISLTVKIKSSDALEKGGVNYDPNANQPY